jgi:hypothetical protein
MGSKPKVRLATLGITALCWLSFCSAALATPPLRVSVDTNECATAGQIDARLLAQDPALKLARDDEPGALDAHFGLERTKGAVVGRLTLRSEGSPEMEPRAVQGESCEEVLEALVLVTLVLAEEAKAADQGDGVRAEPTAPAPRAFSIVVGARADPERKRSQLSIAAGLGAIQGVVPGVGLRPHVTSGLELTDAREQVMASLRLSLALALTRKLAEEEAGRAEFWSFSARLDGCGPRLGRNWSVEGCATFELGRLQASGTGTDHDASPHAQWLAAGGLARLLVPLQERLRLELELGVFARLRQAQFYFVGSDGSPQSAFELEPWGLAGALGLGWSFL